MRAWFRRTNRAYDELADTKPVLRFLLFFAPIVCATLVDLVLTYTGIFPGSNFTLLAVLGVMALWRFLGIFRI